MATPASKTVPSSPNPSSQSSPRNRDWSSLRTGEPGSAFRGIGRGRGSRGGSVRGGRGGGHPPTSSGQNGGSQPDTANSTPSPTHKAPVSQKPPAPTSTGATTNGAPERALNGSAERGGRPKSGSRKQPRAVPAVVVAPPSPSQTSQTAPPTPSKSANRRRRPQPGKGPASTSKPPPLPPAIKPQKSRSGSTPASQIVMRKDIPPHLAAAHDAEIRHDIDVLVERVRAVAMAENRPTTPGSHIDWAGDEDDSLPDLDDWGVTTTHNNLTHGEDQSDEISPILADTLKPLPEPNSEVHQEEEREMETYDTPSERLEKSPIRPPFLPSPTQEVPPSAGEVPEQCVVVPQESSSSALSDEKLPLHPSLPPKPVAAMESSHARGSLISNSTSPPASASEEEVPTTTAEGLSQSMHAPSVDERLALERVSSASASERGLAASMHAPVPGLPESHSAPSLLPAHSVSRTQTEGRPGGRQPNTAPPGATSHRRGRSGASSPLGRHVYTHARNHSTPAGGAAGPRVPQASRPVITGEAISRLARTIGGLPPSSRTQPFPVTKDAPISSDLQLTS